MQKINLKKTTKEQMLNMLEKAWNANAGAADDIAALSKRIEEQNDALAKCVAEKNELRNQARDARGNAEYWHGRFNNAFGVTEVQRQQKTRTCARSLLILRRRWERQTVKWQCCGMI